MSYKQYVFQEGDFQEAEPTFRNYFYGDNWNDLLITNTKAFINSEEGDKAHEEMNTWFNWSATGYLSVIKSSLDKRYIDKCSKEAIEKAIDSMSKHLDKPHVNKMYLRFKIHQWKRKNDIEDLSEDVYKNLAKSMKDGSDIKKMLEKEAAKILAIDNNVIWRPTTTDEGKSVFINVKTGEQINNPQKMVIEEVPNPSTVTGMEDGSGRSTYVVQQGWKRTMIGRGFTEFRNAGKLEDHKIVWDYTGKNVPDGLERHYEFRNLKHAQLIIHQTLGMEKMGFMVAPIINEISQSNVEQKKLLASILVISGILATSVAMSVWSAGWEALELPAGYNAGLESSVANNGETMEALGILAVPGLFFGYQMFHGVKDMFFGNNKDILIKEKLQKWITTLCKKDIPISKLKTTYPFLVSMKVFTLPDDEDNDCQLQISDFKLGTIIERKDNEVSIQGANEKKKIDISDVYFFDNFEDKFEPLYKEVLNKAKATYLTKRNKNYRAFQKKIKQQLGEKIAFNNTFDIVVKKEKRKFRQKEKQQIEKDLKVMNKKYGKKQYARELKRIINEKLPLMLETFDKKKKKEKKDVVLRRFPHRFTNIRALPSIDILRSQ